MFAQSEKRTYGYVLLDASGRTLDTLYVYGGPLETDEALETRWEQERSNADRAFNQTLGDDGEAFLIQQWF